ncbi:hypothetical protein RRG08_053545 [Elysia crispata]|uniref:Uncharacterized protein n=1 Tax=Elysia crispata TaxID=231223 RepID=A0AAE1CVM8_9GAST|nr:hypothetical protein RRG08_053545 [Elysia crispata]
MLQLIHQSHLGIKLSQNRAKTAIFWSGMRRQIEEKENSYQPDLKSCWIIYALRTPVSTSSPQQEAHKNHLLVSLDNNPQWRFQQSHPQHPVEIIRSGRIVKLPTRYQE